MRILINQEAPTYKPPVTMLELIAELWLFPCFFIDVNSDTSCVCVEFDPVGVTATFDLLGTRLGMPCAEDIVVATEPCPCVVDGESPASPQSLPRELSVEVGFKAVNENDAKVDVVQRDDKVLLGDSEA